MSFTRYQRAAAIAIKAHLEENGDRESFVFAYLAEGVADPAARAAGKKFELFDSLWSYERLLPPGASVYYNESQAKVRNPYYLGGRTEKPEVALAGPFDVAIDFGPGKAYMPHSVIP